MVKPTVKKRVAVALVAVIGFIGLGYFSNQMTVIACEEEVQQASNEQWKNTRTRGWIKDPTQKFPWLIQVEYSWPDGSHRRSYFCAFGMPFVIRDTDLGY